MDPRISHLCPMEFLLQRGPGIPPREITDGSWCIHGCTRGLLGLEQENSAPLPSWCPSQGLSHFSWGLSHSFLGLSPPLPGSFPTLPGVFSTFPGVSPTFPWMPPTFPGVLPTLPGVSPTFPGIFPTFPGVLPTLPGPLFPERAAPRSPSPIPIARDPAGNFLSRNTSGKSRTRHHSTGTGPCSRGTIPEPAPLPPAPKSSGIPAGSGALPGTGERQVRSGTFPVGWSYGMGTCSLTQLAHPPEARGGSRTEQRDMHMEAGKEAMREMLAPVREAPHGKEATGRRSRGIRGRENRGNSALGVLVFPEWRPPGGLGNGAGVGNGGIEGVGIGNGEFRDGSRGMGENSGREWRGGNCMDSAKAWRGGQRQSCGKG